MSAECLSFKCLTIFLTHPVFTCNVTFDFLTLTSKKVNDCPLGQVDFFRALRFPLTQMTPVALIPVPTRDISTFLS